MPDPHSLREPIPAPSDAAAILRDCRALYLERLGALLHEADYVSVPAEEAFRDGVGRYFDDMAAGGRRPRFGDVRGSAGADIALVGDRDLALDIRLGECVARLVEATGTERWPVHQCFVTVLNRPELANADNPVHPKGIARGLGALCATLNEAQDRTLARLERLERHFSAHLAGVYVALHDFFVARMAAPAPAGRRASPESHPPGRDHEIRRIAESYSPLFAEFDRQAPAYARCRAVVEQFCARGLPESIAHFLRTYWRQVLLDVWLLEGEQSGEWQDELAVVEQLLWSIEAKTAAADRKRLPQMLPAMFMRLDAGMARIGMADEAKAAFLDSCFALQSLALRGAAVDRCRPAPAVGTEELGELQRGGLRLRTLRHGVSPPPPASIAHLQVGDWVDFAPGGDERLCGRICRIETGTGSLLLVNPAWPFAFAMAREVLAAQIAERRATVVSAVALFPAQPA